MIESSAKVLLLCYGNPGRLDDGLGAAFAAAMEQKTPAGATVEVDYQLMVEHAAAVAERDVVVFVDAAVSGPEPFSFRRLEPRPAFSYSSHCLEPENLLALAEELFGARAAGYALGIRGYEFDDFGESLSSGALDNLSAALTFLVAVLQEGKFRETATSLEGSGGQTAYTGEIEWRTANI